MRLLRSVFNLMCLWTQSLKVPLCQWTHKSCRAIPIAHCFHSNHTSVLRLASLRFPFDCLPLEIIAARLFYPINSAGSDENILNFFVLPKSRIWIPEIVDGENWNAQQGSCFSRALRALSQPCRRYALLEFEAPIPGSNSEFQFLVHNGRLQCKLYNVESTWSVRIQYRDW